MTKDRLYLQIISLEEFSFVASGKKCEGNVQTNNLVQAKEVVDCARHCKDVASMFSVRVKVVPICKCFAGAKANGTCTQIEDNGFELYKYK